MKIKLILLIFFIIIYKNYIYSQNAKHSKDLYLYTIHDSCFAKIISNVVIYNARCFEYKDDNIYGVFIYKYNDSIFSFSITIDSKKILLQGFGKNNQIKPYGYFDYYQYRCLLIGERPPSIFKKTDTKTKYIINDKPNLEGIINDPITWYYYLKNDKFIFYKRSQDCGN